MRMHKKKKKKKKFSIHPFFLFQVEQMKDVEVLNQKYLHPGWS